jgi:hypothetical protein
MQGLIMHARNNHNDNQYPDALERFVMNGIEWLTLNAAAKLPECEVTGKTLREMIQRGEVPDGHWMKQPYGDNVIYFIDRAILPSLPYRKQGKRGKNKPQN